MGQLQGVITTKAGSALSTGDLFMAFGRSHRIVELRPYPNLPDVVGVPSATGRIAVCDTGLEITRFDSDPYEVMV